MIEAAEFVNAAREAGFDWYAGVPCSFLTPFINYVIGEPALTYVSAANEGDAVAVAAGAVIGGRGGAIGWGIGATMGAQCANPDRPVIGIIGDGSSMMTIQGLWTAANDTIPCVFVICNNGMYRVLKVNMDIYKKDILKEEEPGSSYMYMDFTTPFDVAAIATAWACTVRGSRSRTRSSPRLTGHWPRANRPCWTW